MHVPTHFGHEGCRLEDLRIVAGFKAGAKLYLISVFKPDTIVCHSRAIVQRGHIKSDTAEVSGCTAAIINLIAFHQELLTEALIICSIRRRNAGIGIGCCSLTYLEYRRTLFRHVYRHGESIVVQSVLIPGHLYATVDLSGSGLCRSPRNGDLGSFEMINQYSRCRAQNSAIHFHELYGIVAHGIGTDVHHANNVV